MKLRVCPKCKAYMDEDANSWWCDNCDHEISKANERIEHHD